MSDISYKDVEGIAELCRLKLTKEETNQIASEMRAILDYVEQLNEVDISGFEPTSQVTGLQNITRKDVVVDYGPNTKELLKNAPATKDNQIKVKRMIT